MIEELQGIDPDESGNVSAFERVLGEVIALRTPSSIVPLLGLLRDNAEYDELMFSIIDGLEIFEDKDYVTEILRGAGQFGDAFGAVNALFSSAAVVFAVWAVMLQKQELQDTRAEFEKQTKIHDAHLQLLRDETKERRNLLELSYKPHLMLRNPTHRDARVGATLINAGAPIFDLKVIGVESPGGAVDLRAEAEYDPKTRRRDRGLVAFLA